jgi:nucleotide-binding universal stress UspA family protein
MGTETGRTVIAAIDSTSAARAVLETAIRFGGAAGAQVEAVHVRRGSTSTMESLAREFGVPLRIRDGDVEGTILDVICEPQVIAAVMGARATTGGRRPVGRTAAQVLEGAMKPVLIVPPEATPPDGIKRFLLPLEGKELSSAAAVRALEALLKGEMEFLVIHIFTERSLPRMLDHPVRDLELLAKEFMATHLPHASSVELKSGHVGQRVVEACHGGVVDLVVLSWSQDTSGDHARVVKEVLSTSPVPVLLFPVGPE